MSNQCADVQRRTSIADQWNMRDPIPQDMRRTPAIEPWRLSTYNHGALAYPMGTKTIGDVLDAANSS